MRVMMTTKKAATVSGELALKSGSRLIAGNLGAKSSTIDHEARRAAAIVRDLLTFSRGRSLGSRQLVDLNAVVRYAFEDLELHRVEAACQPDNMASRRVLEKAGFRQEGVAQSYLKINGAWRDHVLTALPMFHVGGLNIRYKNVIGIENRFRINDDGGSLDRAESIAFLNAWRLRADVSYVRLNEELSIAGLTRREELNGRLTGKITSNWNVGVAWRQDLVTNQLIQQDFILGYRDECSSLEVTYRRDRTTDVGLESDNAFLIRFTLRSLVNS